jgi:hypothetical protein
MSDEKKTEKTTERDKQPLYDVTAKHLRCCAVELEHQHQRYVAYVRACRQAAPGKKLDTAAEILEHLMGNSSHTVAVQMFPHVIAILETLRLHPTHSASVELSALKNLHTLLRTSLGESG